MWIKREKRGERERERERERGKAPKDAVNFTADRESVLRTECNYRSIKDR